MNALKVATLTVVIAASSLARADKVDSFSPSEVKSIARELASKVAMPLDKQGDLWKRLDAALDDPGFFADRPPITGVIVYQRGGGGFIVKVQKAKAFGRFRSRKAIAALHFEQISYGATIGGGTEYGVALVLGLHDLTMLGGEYNGGTRGGTMGKASMSITEVTKKGTSPGTPGYHKLFLIGTGAGAGADAGGANLKLQLINWME